MKNRGRLIDLDEDIEAPLTVHPSHLLRLPDEDAKAREYRPFAGDLKTAAVLLRKSARRLARCRTELKILNPRGLRAPAPADHTARFRSQSF